MIELGGPVAGHPMTGHMALHIVSMNVAAPLAILILNHATAGKAAFSFRHSLWAASIAQICVLWGWHAPGVLEWAVRAPGAHALMQLSLVAVALWFWGAVLGTAGTHRWRALFALLVTGKLFCLLGALLVFAPRVLYPELTTAGYVHGAGSAAAGLADQQLAGLLMLAACPTSYVLAGIVIAARWLHELDADRPGRAVREPARLVAE